MQNIRDDDWSQVHTKYSNTCTHTHTHTHTHIACMHLAYLYIHVCKHEYLMWFCEIIAVICLFVYVLVYVCRQARHFGQLFGKGVLPGKASRACLSTPCSHLKIPWRPYRFILCIRNTHTHTHKPPGSCSVLIVTGSHIGLNRWTHVDTHAWTYTYHSFSLSYNDRVRAHVDR